MGERLDAMIFSNRRTFYRGVVEMERGKVVDLWINTLEHPYIDKDKIIEVGAILIPYEVEDKRDLRDR